MRKFLLFILVFVQTTYSQEYLKMIEDGSFKVSEIQEKAKTYFSVNGTGKGSGYKQYKRWEDRAIIFQDEEGYLITKKDIVTNIKDYNQAQNISLLKSNYGYRTTSETGLWESMGPDYYEQTSGFSPGVGRITSLVIPEDDENTLIVGSPSGGVWKSEDAGGSWNCISDDFFDMNVFSLTIDPQDSTTYYWGATIGAVYVSYDSGDSWQEHSDIGAGDVVRLLLNPNDSNIMFAATWRNGLHKTTDGGTNWEQITDDTFGYDFEYHPSDPNIIYAAGNGFHVSYDGGTTWNTSTEFESSPKLIAVTPAAPNVVYVVEMSTEIDGFGKLYKSIDSGNTFDVINEDGINYLGFNILGADTRSQAPRDMGITISTTDPNEVHLAGINTWRSLDGGETFTCSAHWLINNARRNDVGYVHSDVDDIYHINDKLYVVSDGGVFVAEDPAGDITFEYFTDLTTGMGIQQVKRMGISKTDPVKIVAGSQDNGSMAYVDNIWKSFYGNDGMDCFFDPEDQSIIYSSYQRGNFIKSSNGDTSSVVSKPESVGHWSTPFFGDENEGGVIYCAFTSVYKSSDYGVTWEAISEILDGSNMQQGAVSPSNNNYIAATSGSNLYLTTDGGTSWNNLSPTLSQISSIDFHPNEDETIAISVVDSEKVFITYDAGQNWEVVNTGLPSDFKAMKVAWEDNDKHGLYLGMSYGVYYISDELTEWQAFSNLLPNSIVNDLDVNDVDGYLYAGTWGRGVWRTPLYGSSLLSNELFVLEDQTTVYPNPTSDYLTIHFEETARAELRLFDASGNLKYVFKNKELKEYVFDVSKLDEGIYFLRINSELGELTKKIIVE